MLDETDFPGTVPFLDGFLSLDGVFHGVVEFVPHQGMDCVFLGKALDDVVLVVPDPLDRVGCYAELDGTVGFGGHEVDAR